MMTSSMISANTATETFANTQLRAQTAQRFFSLYLKPLVLATASALLLAFLVAYSCISLAAGGSAAGKKDKRQNAVQTEMANKTAMHTSVASTAN